MNVDVPGLIKAAVPEAQGRNARIISQNEPNHRDPNFLSDNYPRSPPKLYLTAESDEFDELILSEWRDEGFDVEYLPMGKAGKGGEVYRRKLRSLSAKKMGPCETFGIIAFGDAAAHCLEHYHVLDNNPEFKLSLLIAYYPTAIPDPQGQFPSSIRALVHLPVGEEIAVIKQSQMVGIQGKRRRTIQKVESGIGTGGTLRLAYRTYTYHAAAGFAEHDMDDYDGVCAELAWSRSLAAARKAFAKDADLESVVEENVQAKFFTRNLSNALSAFTTSKTPHVTHVPTLTGGVGADELERFYGQFFSNAPSMRQTLLSRTIGPDRVVDEVHVRFKHSQTMSWILPGVPPTNRRVEVVVVSIVALRGGKLYHEHVYWDQASVLVQVGLLDPDVIPKSARHLGIDRLPVVGREAAKRALKNRRGGGEGETEEGEADNELIPGWHDGEEDEDEDGESGDEDDDGDGDDDGDDDDDDGSGEEDASGEEDGSGEDDESGEEDGEGSDDDGGDVDGDVSAGSEAKGSDTNRKEAKGKEARENEVKEREAKEKEAREKEAKEKEIKEKEAKDKEAKEKEAKDKKAKDKKAKEKKAKEKKAREEDEARAKKIKDEEAEAEKAKKEEARVKKIKDEEAEAEKAKHEGAEDEVAEDEVAEDEVAEDEGTGDEGTEDEGAENEDAEAEKAKDEETDVGTVQDEEAKTGEAKDDEAMGEGAVGYGAMGQGATGEGAMGEGAVGEGAMGEEAKGEETKTDEATGERGMGEESEDGWAMAHEATGEEYTPEEATRGRTMGERGMGERDLSREAEGERAVGEGVVAEGSMPERANDEEAHGEGAHGYDLPSR